MIRPVKNVSSVNGSTNFVDGKYYHLYDRMLTDRAPGLYRKLLSEAKNTIAIWDPHYYECNGDLFDAIHQDGIKIDILTICYRGEEKNELEDFAHVILNAIDECDVPSCQVWINALAPQYLRQTHWTEWHDRYLIIDDTRVFLVGASIDAQETTRKSFGIYELSDIDDINCVMDAYNSYKAEIIDLSSGVRGNGYKCYLHRP